jgi:hypothetical protein
MLLRLLAYSGLGIDAVIRHEWFLALLCFVTPFIRAAGMGTAIAAGVVFLALGQYTEGGIAIGVVVYNLVGNRLVEMVKSFGMRRSAAIYEKGLRLIQVTLYHALSTKYALTLDLETAKILAAQVSNYLKGDDIEEVMQHCDEPLKSNIARIRTQVPDYAARAMMEDKDTREVVVANLRMRVVVNFGLIGASYLTSADKVRAENLLSLYGPEFPDATYPAEYLALAQRYRKEHW